MRSVRRMIAGVAAGGTLAAAGLLATALPAQADEIVIEGSGLSVVISDDVLEPGQTFTVDVTYTNDTGGPLRLGTAFSGDPTDLASEFAFVSCTASAGATCSGGASNPGGVGFDLDFPTPLAAGAVVTGSFVFVVDDDAPGGHTDTFSTTVQRCPANGPCEFVSPGQAVLTIAEAEADVAVSLDATASLLSSRITYDVVAANTGPGDVGSATVVVDLPTQVSSVSGLPAGCTYASATDEVTCATGAIADGDEFAGSFSATLGLLSIGQLPATATRTASTPTDPNPGNDTAAADCSVLTSLLVSCP
ncbi:hypothetical protein [Isoptericola sp. NPDC057559]|uniref:hypothetical protein n=1 Tax=Isoptericola sp. NPDC057559 TaxID=3346168 RepID=UPI0036C59A1E